MIIFSFKSVSGKYFKFGTEHLGGIARATTINDVNALNQIAALETFTNKFDKTKREIMNFFWVKPK